MSKAAAQAHKEQERGFKVLEVLNDFHKFKFDHFTYYLNCFGNRRRVVNKSARKSHVEQVDETKSEQLVQQKMALRDATTREQREATQFNEPGVIPSDRQDPSFSNAEDVPFRNSQDQSYSDHPAAFFSNAQVIKGPLSPTVKLRLQHHLKHLLRSLKQHCNNGSWRINDNKLQEEHVRIF